MEVYLYSCLIERNVVLKKYAIEKIALCSVFNFNSNFWNQISVERKENNKVELETHQLRFNCRILILHQIIN